MNEYLKNIKVDEKKIDSILFYATEKEEDFSLNEFFQAAVNAAVDKAFKKYVPKSVREYIQKDKTKNKEGKKDVKQSNNNGQNCSGFGNQTNLERH